MTTTSENQHGLFDYPILVVDDNPNNLQVVGKILRKEGFSVEFATNGETALEWARHQEFNLILLDIMMPGMSGYEVCKKLKQIEGYKEVPVIFLTAKTDAESVVKGFDLGAVDYVTKPFNRKELLARVTTQVKIKQAQQQIGSYLEEIVTKNKLITYSITYAKYIQETIINLHARVPSLVKESFVYFRPRDLVSGDFYWFHETGGKFIAAVMDCTGHGVPAAMMSMMGITLLNEIVREQQVLVPSRILDQLRTKVIETLGQTGVSQEVHDGMDGTIVLVDPNKSQLQFAGAYNGMYLTGNGGQKEVRGDRMPVAHYETMDQFTNHELPFEQGDMVYLYTDGYADQFGGNRNKKLNPGAFRKILRSIHGKPAREQEKAIDTKFRHWKGKNDQLDDVTVIGIRI